MLLLCLFVTSAVTELFCRFLFHQTFLDATVKALNRKQETAMQESRLRPLRGVDLLVQELIVWVLVIKDLI